MDVYGLKKIGVLEIDMDHSNIDKFLMIAMMSGFDETSFNNLKQALIHHFEHEENICKQLNLNMSEAHKTEHHRLTGMLNHMSYTDKSEEEHLLFFKGMLIRHVNDFDSTIIK